MRCGSCSCDPQGFTDGSELEAGSSSVTGVTGCREEHRLAIAHMATAVSVRHVDAFNENCHALIEFIARADVKLTIPIGVEGVEAIAAQE